MTCIGLFVIRYLFQEQFGLVPIQFRFMPLVLFAPFLTAVALHKGKWTRAIGTLWFYAFVAASGYVTLTYLHPA